MTPRGFAGPNLLAMILFEKFGQLATSPNAKFSCPRGEHPSPITLDLTAGCMNRLVPSTLVAACGDTAPMATAQGWSASPLNASKVAREQMDLRSAARMFVDRLQINKAKRLRPMADVAKNLSQASAHDVHAIAVYIGGLRAPCLD
jgi:hypothetical protein